MRTPPHRLLRSALLVFSAALLTACGSGGDALTGPSAIEPTFARSRTAQPDHYYRFVTEFTDRAGNEHFVQLYAFDSTGLPFNDIVRQLVKGSDGTEQVVAIPGRIKWGSFQLKNGVTADYEVWKWREMVVHGHLDEAKSAAWVE